MVSVAKSERLLAYLSMEIALASDIPTYSGGLGVLAGDTLRSMADLEIPAVAVTLSYSTGYFYQLIDKDGHQNEREIWWEFSSEFEKEPVTIKVPLKGGNIRVGAWRYDVVGQTGHVVPVYLLDSDVEGNEPWQRQVTHVLYDATPFQRLVQEIILGMGGVELLERLGYVNVRTYHVNEGHAALLAISLLDKFDGDLEEVRKRLVFTTHTPVEAGHDKYSRHDLQEALGRQLPGEWLSLGGEGDFNLTLLALNASRWANAVSQKHRDTASKMFPRHQLDAVTNGVHVPYWTCEPIANLFDRFLPGWRMKPSVLAKATDLDSEDLWRAHQKAKLALLDYEKSHSWVLLDKKLLTIGFARRVTHYKRPLLVFQDLERLARICRKKVQLIFAGKAHPKDAEGKRAIKKLNDFSDYLWNSYRVRVAFLENYDVDLAKLMVSGVDLWLNNPIRYLEASGTSGMKAALNGVLNLSILDGWWIEGHEFEPLAGWAVGPRPDDPDAEVVNWNREAGDIYEVLENEAIPIFFHNWQKWADRMKHAIRLGAYFNTHRMVEEYAMRAWKLEKQPRWRFVEPD
ncbi:MAG: alpha-glucan family phosphorylase [Promethearchaeota archaeon]